MYKVNIKFKYAPVFNEYWNKYGLTIQDKKDLQKQIMTYMVNGSRLEGTGGAYKFRFASKKDNKGKSGSYQMIYVAIAQGEFYFVAIYAKNEESNLSKAERNILKNTIKRLRGNSDGKIKTIKRFK